MPAATDSNQSAAIEVQAPRRMPGRAVLVAVAGILAAWIAAGSVGWLAPPLAKALCWLMLGTGVLVSAPGRREAIGRWAIVVGVGSALAVLMTASSLPVVNISAVVMLLAAIAATESGMAARGILLAAWAAAVLAAFRLAGDSTATVWAAADRLGGLLGGLAGWAAGRRLQIGASFGGVEFLVLMAALEAGWLAATAPPRRGRAVWATLAILAAHAFYLLVLAFSCDLAAALPTPVRPTVTDLSALGVWTWGNALRTLLPWKLPLLAAGVHPAVAAIMFRTSAWLPTAEPSSAGRGQAHFSARLGRKMSQSPGPERFAPAALAVVAAVALVLTTAKPDLEGRRIVAYDPGDIDWTVGDRPHPQPQSSARFGLLPALVESLGGQMARTGELSDEELAGADLVLLLPPGPGDVRRGNRRLTAAGAAGASPEAVPPEAVERIWQFVRRGGSLLVAAEPENHPHAVENIFNTLLEPTALRVRDDQTISLTRRWEHNYQPAPHAATAGIDAGRNGFGLDRAASIRTAWPAGPLVVGRWGWSQSPCEAAEADLPPYTPGERLGDLVLAAGQRLGSGSVVVLGDALCLADDRTPQSYLFTGRLLAALAGNAGGRLALWREAIGILALIGFVVMAAWRAEALGLAVAAVALAVAVAASSGASDATARLLPQGRPQSAHPVACLDASHLEAFSADPASDDGLGEFMHTLAESGHLPLCAPDLSPERLNRAALLVSIAPGRPFAPGEQTAVREFVNSGGIFVSMTGAGEAGPSRPLLAQFGLGLPHLPASPSEICREPEPLGATVHTYGHAPEWSSTMRFYAAWPVEHGAEAENLTLTSDGTVYHSVAVSQHWGSGQAVLLGDTCFAMHKNFEAHPGNSDYCKWLWAHLEGRPELRPKAEPAEGSLLDVPKPAPPQKKAEPAESSLLDAFKPARPRPAADGLPDASKPIQPRPAADMLPDVSKPVQPRQEKAKP